MAANVLVDTSFLVAFLNRRDSDHRWATSQAAKSDFPWKTCEPVLSEAFYVLGPHGGPRLIDLLNTRALICAFQIGESIKEVLDLFQKYADVPMSLADACLVRMTEILPDPVLLTTDTDFRIYRRNGRQTIPCVSPLDD
jgi:predicted nucleic acid-binding protein